MKSKRQMYSQLVEFISQDKFSEQTLNDRGLIASETELSNYLNDHFNNCSKILIQLLDSDGTKKEFKKVLKISLS